MQTDNELFIKKLYTNISSSVTLAAEEDTYKISNEISKLTQECPAELHDNIFWWEKYAFSWYRLKNKAHSSSSFWDYFEVSDLESPYKYWLNRINDVDEPFLKVFYSCLCWDFANYHNLSRNNNTAQIAISSIIEFLSRDTHKSSFLDIDWLEWALNTSFNIKDYNLADKVRNAICKLHDDISEDHHCGTWLFLFDLLLNDKKIKDKIVSQELEEKIIQELENKLERLHKITDDCFRENQLAAYYATIRLAGYYKKANRNNEILAVLQKYKKLILNLKYESDLVKLHFLEELYYLLNEYSLIDEAKDISVLLSKVGQESIKEGQDHYYEMSVTQEELQNCLHSLTDGKKLPDILNFIAFHYVPNISKSEIELEHSAEKFSGVYKLFPITIRDHKGRKIASIGTYPEDKVGQLVHFVAMEIQTGYPFFLIN